MRTLAVLAVLSAMVALGGCFHHHQQAAVTELPPLK
jgi:hypothetical protein